MKALGKNVIITRHEPETSTAAGIIYTDNTKVTYATVITVGEEVTTVAVGNELVVNWNAAIPVKIDGTQYYIVHIDQVYVVV